MVKKITWTSSALDDLEKVVDYIFQDSPIYALTFYDKVKETARGLDELAERGRIVPEYEDKNIREVFVHHYRLIYQILDKQVIILTFIHGARLLNN